MAAAALTSKITTATSPLGQELGKVDRMFWIFFSFKLSKKSRKRYIL
jgi:hypothetical protein